jgi:hypothetical protein
MPALHFNLVGAYPRMWSHSGIVALIVFNEALFSSKIVNAFHDLILGSKLRIVSPMHQTL